MKKNTSQKASTLLEILIYFSILAVVLLSGITFAIQILNMSKLSSNFNELEGNLDFISQKIVATIQTADSINIGGSIFDNDQGALSLNLSTPAKSPTRFYLSSGNIFVTEGVSSPSKLNSSIIQFNSLRFHRVTYSKAPDQIVIDADLSIANNDINSLDKTLPLHLSVSLRK